MNYDYDTTTQDPKFLCIQTTDGRQFFHRLDCIVRIIDNPSANTLDFSLSNGGGTTFNGTLSGFAAKAKIMTLSEILALKREEAASKIDVNKS